VEAYPVSAEELVSMNYVEELNALNHKGVFDKMHQSNWGEKENLGDDFSLTKKEAIV
jgi:hypothetical protein